MSDETDAGLAQLGYRQELRRGMSGFSSFAISFSVISILTGGVSMYGYGLQNGGPIEMTLGWPIVAMMTTLVALSLAELASAYPTAGALYHWASVLGGPRVGFYTAWLNFVGQVAVVAGVDYALAQFLARLLGLPDRRVVLLGIYGVLLLMHGGINHIGLGLLDRCNRISAWWHVGGTLLIVGLLWTLAPHREASFLLSTYVHPGADGMRLPMAYACLVGLLQAQWTFTGYDASAHAAEETVDAARVAPRGMLTSVVSSAVVGWLLLLGLTLAVRDLPGAAASENAFAYVVDHALGPALGRLVMIVIVVAMWFCGLASVTSNSRMLFALARDGGVPWAKTVARVGTRYATPHVAVWSCVAVAFLLAIYSRAYNVIVSISTIGLYGSYALPIWAGERARRRGWAPTGPFRLRHSRLVARLALGWIAIITVLFVLPPNQRTGYTFAALVAVLVGADLAWARRSFRGPPELQSPSEVAIPAAFVAPEARS